MTRERYSASGSACYRYRAEAAIIGIANINVNDANAITLNE